MHRDQAVYDRDLGTMSLQSGADKNTIASPFHPSLSRADVSALVTSRFLFAFTAAGHVTLLIMHYDTFVVTVTSPLVD